MLLFCNRKIQWSGEYAAPGDGLLHYSRDGDREEVLLPGPTTTEIQLVVSHCVVYGPNYHGDTARGQSLRGLWALLPRRYSSWSVIAWFYG